MKKTIIILSVLFTLMIAGVLYGKLVQPDTAGTIDTMVYMDQITASMPNLIIDPMVGFPLY